MGGRGTGPWGEHASAKEMQLMQGAAAALLALLLRMHFHRHPSLPAPKAAVQMLVAVVCPESPRPTCFPSS